VVIDANVLFSAPVRDALLRAADRGLFQFNWTNEILDEVRRNLVKTGRSSEEQANRLIATMQAYFPEALATGYESVMPSMTNEPKDRHVLATAVVTRSRIIVTNNLRDFPATVLAPLNIEAQSPDRFLIDLFRLSPELMTEIVLSQANDLRNPPHTVHRVLDKLAEQIPNFAALVRAPISRDQDST